MEVNFDGIPGTTHTFGGLSDDDRASIANNQLPSHPKKAALESLEKMKTLHDLCLKQGILLPQERPFIPVLRTLGYFGTDTEIIDKVYKTVPHLLAACSSAASMWSANAATVSPSSDSQDRRVHFTAANLMSKFHRSFEASTTASILSTIFNHQEYFVHHEALPYHFNYGDEGAANHTRFCSAFDQLGVQLFVYGRSQKSRFLPKKFIARQSEEACQAIFRLHRLSTDRVIFAQQNPEAIDAGVFHNDVISVGNQHVFLYHEKAFVHTPEVIQQIRDRVEHHCKISFIGIEVKNKEISIQEAVKTYLFNSQIITLPNQTMVLIAPKECQDSVPVSTFIQKILADNNQPIRSVIYRDVRESMRNGGGPACLRLRVVLNATEFEAVHSPVILTNALYETLVKWVEKNYRDQLTLNDLGDPQLLLEGRQALDELTHILKMGSIYHFQKLEGFRPPLREERS